MMIAYISVCGGSGGVHQPSHDPGDSAAAGSSSDALSFPALPPLIANHA